jgi:hypothetical protein
VPAGLAGEPGFFEHNSCFHQLTMATKSAAARTNCQNIF